MLNSPTRRNFLQSVAAGSIGFQAALYATPQQSQARSANERVQLGLIGAGWLPDIKRQGRGLAIGKQSAALADVVEICDVDQSVLDVANQRVSNGKARLGTDYRELLSRNDIDAVLIATPDHWHAKMAADALRAGKAVYCEKPATHNVAEGEALKKIVQDTGKPLLVGTQQRTENNHRFSTAVAMIRAGRLGKLKSIHIGLDPGLIGGPFPEQTPEKTFDFEKWLGPAPLVDYRKERTHWTFRWWYEYAGGKICDWGAHHIDIAHWAMNLNGAGPMKVDGSGLFHNEYINGYAQLEDRYNTPSTFTVRCQFPDDIEMVVDSGRNGITFEGTEGRMFVNRGTLEGEPVTRLKTDPLPKSGLEDLYQGPPPKSHMAHFIECVQDGRAPISDIGSHQEAMITCHLANISMRVKRPVHWNSEQGKIENDEIANALLSRTARAGYGIDD